MFPAKEYPIPRGIWKESCWRDLLHKINFLDQGLKVIKWMISHPFDGDEL